MRRFIPGIVGVSIVVGTAAQVAGTPSSGVISPKPGTTTSQETEGPVCVCGFPFQPAVLDPPCEGDEFCEDLFAPALYAACVEGFCFEADVGQLVECESDQKCIDEVNDTRARCLRLEVRDILDVRLTEIPCVLPAQDDPDTYCQGDPCVVSGEINVQNGANVNFGSRAVVVEGTLSVGDGSMTIRAGEFRIAPQGHLDGSGGLGGSFDILVTGDIRIDGERDSGAINLVAEEGGFLSLTSQSGSILGTGDIQFGSASDEGDGGTVEINAGADVNLSGSISGPGGSQSSGGELEIVAGGDVTLAGPIDLSGGFDGGLLFVEAVGSVTLGEINLGGTGDRGNGGEIDIRAGGSVELGGTIHSRGSDLSAESCGDGGRLSIEAGGDLTTLAEVNVNALEGDCRGGEIELAGDRIDIGGPISFSGEGGSGLGGSLDVAANCQFVSRESLNGGGGFEAGTASIEAGCIMVIETVTVLVMEMIGPLECDPIQIQCDPIVIIAGPIDAGPSGERSARGAASPASGSISVMGCSVEVAETAQLIARGAGAFNRIVSRGNTTIAGGMMATSSNEFRFRPGFEPVIIGQVIPAPSLNPDDTLQPCVLPEDTPTPTATTTETTTNTATPVATASPTTSTTPSAVSTSTATPSDTVTQTRTPTPTVVPSTLTPTASATPGGAGPGDTNCDGRITAADIPALVQLIQSNDSGECDLADADQSGTIDALDIPATVRLIFE